MNDNDQANVMDEELPREPGWYSRLYPVALELEAYAKSLGLVVDSHIFYNPGWPEKRPLFQEFQSHEEQAAFVAEHGEPISFRLDVFHPSICCIDIYHSYAAGNNASIIEDDILCRNYKLFLSLDERLETDSFPPVMDLSDVGNFEDGPWAGARCSDLEKGQRDIDTWLAAIQSKIKKPWVYVHDQSPVEGYSYARLRPIPESAAARFLKYFEAQHQLSVELPKRQRKRTPNLPQLPKRIGIGTSRLEAGVMRGFTGLQRWEDDGRDGRTYLHKTQNSQVLSNLPKQTWEALKGQPATVVKMWHVLEAIRQAEGRPMDAFTITPERILREIHATRKSKYLPSEKQNAVDTLDNILKLELEFSWRDSKNVTHRTTGPLYIRTLKDEVYDDLFGYVPSMVRIRVNPDLFDRQISEFARQSTTYHRDFLNLDAGRDEGAIMLGTYICTMARVQSSRWKPGEARFENKTLLQILESSGVINVQSLSEKRQLGQIPDKVMRDLKKLQDVGLIAGWEPVQRGNESETCDQLETQDDVLAAFPENLPSPKRRARADDGKVKAGKYWEWIEGTTRIFLPDEHVQAQELARTAKAQKVATEARKRTRRKKPAAQ